MKNKILFLLLTLLFNQSFSQNQLVKQWDYRYGGTWYDNLFDFQQTQDKGFILGGFSGSSVSGDKTQPLQGTYDYWIVKLDENGLKQWDKAFGGTTQSQFTCMKQTFDKGYIIGGYTTSGIGGDVTEVNRDPSNLTNDYWIIKTDSLGNKQWDKRFGGNNEDKLYCIEQSRDGGYILGGFSSSPLSGDKTQAPWGNFTHDDFWVLKIDPNGVKQWDKIFGGTEEEYCKSIVQTSDGGFILAGGSKSGISGDKTQSSQGDYDYWVVRVDSLGNKMWDKRYGGSDGDLLMKIQHTREGGYILGGYTQSNISGDKTENSQGGYDFWIVKIDSGGVLQWDKNFGGTNDEDAFGSVSQTMDGGYLISGSSYSDMGGDKTENILGIEEPWVIKTDSLGTKQWDKDIFLFTHNEEGFSLQTSDGCYAIATYTNSWIAGYKSQDNWDVQHNTGDYWIVKFCDSTLVTPIAAAGAPNYICPGTCTNFINLSQNATSYQWFFPGSSTATSTDENPINICYNSPGTYDVELIATNSSGSDTLVLPHHVTVYPLSPPQSILQSGDSLISNTGFVSYQWFYNGDTITGATNYYYVATQSGDYNLVSNDENGCPVEAVIFNVLANLEDLNPFHDINIYPNPASKKLVISSSKVDLSASRISIFNSIGEKILTVNLPGKSAHDYTLDCSNLEKGQYWLEVVNNKNNYRTKFIKN